MNNFNLKKINGYFFLILLIGLLIALFGVSTEISAITIIGILIMFCSIIFRVIFYRCPHCGHYLDRSTGEYCPKCGEKVNETE